MMSLVAYGSSGESENESDNDMETESKPEKTSTVPKESSNNGVTSLPSKVADVKRPKLTSDLHSKLPAPQVITEAKGGLHSKLPPPKTAVENVADDDSEDSLGLKSILPAPKHHTTSSLLEGSLVLTKDSKGKTKKGTVKIMIPSLADFPEDEDVPKVKKKIQPSAKGSGLFALLPPPKQATAKAANRSLVPNVLTRKPTPTPPPKKVPPKSSIPSAKRKQPDSDPESDGEGESVDFFSLNKEDKLPEIPFAEVALPAASNEFQTPGTSAMYVDPSSSYQQDTAYGQYQHQQYEQPTEGTSLPQANSGQDYIGFSGNEGLQLDDEALMKLCGRKGRNREEIEILDVSGDSIMPNQREWLTKQLTEEQPRSSSKSKLFGPSSQQKRKHQITYLAHIAKENELELKNQWASNRQTRKQTQSKYGF